MSLSWLFAVLVLLAPSSTVNGQSSCSVFDPFKVLPDNNKVPYPLSILNKEVFQFQIGGAFPLHEEDCSRLRPDTVQEVVAIQWALTHWNQNPANFNAKLGLYAGDTCSRPREALSQSLRFLDSVGFHEPEECRNPTPAPRLLGGLSLWFRASRGVCPADRGDKTRLSSVCRWAHPSRGPEAMKQSDLDAWRIRLVRNVL